MGKMESIIKCEIVRLAKRELRRISVPLGRDVRLLESTVSQLRKAVLVLERMNYPAASSGVSKTLNSVIPHLMRNPVRSSGFRLPPE